MLAARVGALDIAKLLVERGADVNAKEAWRDQTALMWAVDGNFPELTQFLIDQGADVNVRASANDWDSQITSEPRAQYRPVGGLTALAVRGALRLHALRALAARGRRRHQSADAGRHDAADDRDRQHELRHRARAARRRREPARLGLVRPHGAVRGRRHEHFPRAAAAPDGVVRDLGDGPRPAVARGRRQSRTRSSTCIGRAAAATTAASPTSC